MIRSNPEKTSASGEGRSWPAAGGEAKGPGCPEVAMQRPWQLPCDGKEKPNVAAMGGSRILAQDPGDSLRGSTSPELASGPW